MLLEYIEGDKADMHAAGFAVNGFSIGGAFDISDGVFDLDLDIGGGRAQLPEIDHARNEKDFIVAECM